MDLLAVCFVRAIIIMMPLQWMALPFIDADGEGQTMTGCHHLLKLLKQL